MHGTAVGEEKWQRTKAKGIKMRATRGDIGVPGVGRNWW
jgi:hypothetical protein